MAGCFEYYADLADKLDQRQGQALQLPVEEFEGAIRREPLGVVGLITPWNYPMLMAAVSFNLPAHLFPNTTLLGLQSSECNSVTCIRAVYDCSC